VEALDVYLGHKDPCAACRKEDAAAPRLGTTASGADADNLSDLLASLQVGGDLQNT